jgi:hypothetical protein
MDRRLWVPRVSLDQSRLKRLQSGLKNVVDEASGTLAWGEEAEMTGVVWLAT